MIQTAPLPRKPSDIGLQPARDSSPAPPAIPRRPDSSSSARGAEALGAEEARGHLALRARGRLRRQDSSPSQHFRESSRRRAWTPAAGLESCPTSSVEHRGKLSAARPKPCAQFLAARRRSFVTGHQKIEIATQVLLRHVIEKQAPIPALVMRRRRDERRQPPLDLYPRQH